MISEIEPDKKNEFGEIIDEDTGLSFRDYIIKAYFDDGLGVADIVGDMNMTEEQVLASAQRLKTHAVEIQGRRLS